MRVFIQSDRNCHARLSEASAEQWMSSELWLLKASTASSEGCSVAKKDAYQNGYQSHSVMRIDRTFTTLFIKHLLNSCWRPCIQKYSWKISKFFRKILSQKTLKKFRRNPSYDTLCKCMKKLSSSLRNSCQRHFCGSLTVMVAEL